MKLSKASGTLGLAVLAAISSPSVLAAESGWIGGLNIGQSQAYIDDVKIRSDLRAIGLTSHTWSVDDHDTAFKIFGGYKFNKYFALEGGYFDLGRFAITTTTTPAGTQTQSIMLKGVNLDAVGILPVTEKYSAFARVGVNYAQAKDNLNNTGAVGAAADPTPSQNAYNFKAGVGMQYDFTDSVGLRGEFERYRINDALGSRGDIDMLSVGLVMTLGKTPAPVPEKVEEAPPPQAAAVEEPVLVIVPVKVKTQRYCSILDIQFEINQDDIQREEKEKLAVVGTFLNKYPDTTAVIEGHSDNVGDPQHNIDLSKRRAESVVNYLIEALHIAPARLASVGYGDSRPVADNSTEQGKRLNRRINAVIACATDIAGLKVVPARVTMALEMEFDRNQADIKPEYADDLRKVADFLKANPAISATVEGHTGNLRASQKAVMEISQHRAQNVVRYLVDNLGVARSQLSTASFGQARRFAYNTSLEGQQENRRVNIIFNYAK